MKRFLGLALSLLLVLGTMGFPVVMAEETDGTRMILDFSNEDLVKAFGMVSETYADGTEQIATMQLTTLKENEGRRTENYYLREDRTAENWSNYRKINARVYVPEGSEGVKLGMQLIASNWNAGHIDPEITLDEAGWHTVSWDFLDYIQPTNKWVRYGLGPQQMRYLNIVATAPKAGAVCALAKVWLSDPYGVDEVGVANPPAGHILADFTTARDVGNARPIDGVADVLTVDQETAHLGNQSAKWKPVSGGSTLLVRFANQVRPSNYKYFNIMMRSTGTHGQGFTLFLYPYQSGDPKNDTGGSNNGRGDIYLRTTKSEQWGDSDWHIFSFPVEDFLKEKRGTNITLGNEYGAFLITAGGYSSGELLEGVEYNLDMIWLSTEAPQELELTGMKPSNQYDDMDPVNASVTFTFNSKLQNVKEVNLAGALKKAGSNESIDLSIVKEENTLTMLPDASLEESTTYELTIPADTIFNSSGMSNTQPITYSFTTASSGLSVTLPTLTDGAGTPLAEIPDSGIIKASTTVKSRGMEEAKPATLVLACYDANNCMVACAVDSKAIAVSATETLEVEVTAAENIVAVKAFVVDSLTSLQPLQNDFAQLPVSTFGGGSQAPGTQTAAVTLNRAALDVNQLFIVGKVDGALPRMTVIAVNGKTAEKPLFVYPFSAEGDGTFDVETMMPETAASGEYEVSVTARRIDGRQTASFPYIGRQEQKTLTQRLNAADIQGEVTALLQANRTSLGLPDNDTLFAHVAQVIFEQKPYDDYAAFFAMAEQAESVLTKLNLATWADYSELLAANPMILNGHTDENYYNSLSATEKAKLNQAISKSTPFESFVQLRAVFTQAVADYKNNKGNTGSSGNKGGGSSGGGKKGGSAVSLVSMPSELLPVVPSVVATPPEPDRTEERFADLAAAEWARESVERLYSAGAIAAAEQFRPNDSVTREEFIKLAAEALDLEKSTAAATFTDVDSDAWYAPYIAAMQSKGIVTGYADGRFGVGEQMTRQDMAVLLSRILEVKGITLPEGEVQPFADDGEISGYAREAVYRMRNAGVISGMEDGSFAPAQSASRAQAAKLLCGLLDLLKQ